MKTEHIVLALWMVTRVAQPAAGRASFVNTIPNAARPGDDAYGWQYFDNGTVIDPNGAYWLNGAMVWAPSSWPMP